MNYDEAKALIKHHAYDGVAYTSRYGQYPSKQEVAKITDALEAILEYVRGKQSIEKDLAGWLFTINDQIQGNYNGATAKGIELKTKFYESVFFQLNELMYAIFEE